MKIFYREAGDPARPAMLQLFDTGHFALEEDAVPIANAIVRSFGTRAAVTGH